VLEPQPSEPPPERSSPPSSEPSPDESLDESPDPSPDDPPRGRVRVHPVVATAGAYAWRLIAIGIVGWAVLELLAALWVLVLAAAVAMLLSRALDPVARRLHRAGLRPALVAATTLLGFLAVLAGILWLLVPAIVDEFSDLGPTLEDAVDDLENWLVEDSPFDISRQDIDEFRDEAGNRASDALESQSGTVVSGTVMAFEVITALVLGLITTFFVLKDGARFSRWLLGFVPDHRQTLAGRLAARSWRTLGGYLRGSAMLGVIEGTIIGVTVWLVGGSLAIPVAVVTFFAAFIPFAGAVVAGAIAVLVTLVTAGVSNAVIVLIVAVAVQQFDSDLLAPIVFGRNLQLHPLIVLAAIVGGSTLFGAFGAVLAVPVVAVVINVLAEWRAHVREEEGGGAEADTGPTYAPPTPADTDEGD
jgi:predicted PurR-regulated permease PerM